MIFINKALNQARGNQIVSDFLAQGWNDDEMRYIGIDYDALPKDDMRNLLLQEQDYLCCYCLRSLNEVPVTLEHVIPRL